MYHIKDDKRARKSAMLIGEGLMATIGEKPYTEITIAEVCAPGGVARTTFYRLFDSLDDVLLYLLDQVMEEGVAEYLKAVGDGDGNGKPYALVFLEAAMRHPDLVGAAAESGRYDLFRIAARERNEAFAGALRLAMGDVDFKYCMSMLNAIWFSALRIWVEGGCKESPAEVYEIAKRNLEAVCERL